MMRGQVTTLVLPPLSEPQLEKRDTNQIEKLVCQHVSVQTKNPAWIATCPENPALKFTMIIIYLHRSSPPGSSTGEEAAVRCQQPHPGEGGPMLVLRNMESAHRCSRLHVIFHLSARSMHPRAVPCLGSEGIERVTHKALPSLALICRGGWC